MKKGFCFLFFMIAGFITLHSQTINLWVNDTAKAQNVLLGYGDRTGLENSDFNQYILEEYESYEADEGVCSYLEKNTDSLEITIVLGTWCHDSKEQVPRFFKILDKIRYNSEKVELIGVGGDKLAGEVDISGLNIEYVPTFIFYKNEKELGRIIETPMSTLEEDMMLIIRNQ